MRYRWLGLFLFISATFICSQAAVAQPDGGSVGFFLGGSGSASAARIARQASTGYGGIAGVSLSPWLKSAPEISLRAIASFDSFGGNNPQLSDFEFVRAGLDLRFVVSNRLHRPVYLLLGGGYAHVSIDGISSSGGEQKRARNTSAYISPGLGMEIANSGSVRFFVEGRFTDIDGQSRKDYQFWTLTAGVSF